MQTKKLELAAMDFDQKITPGKLEFTKGRFLQCGQVCYKSYFNKTRFTGNCGCQPAQEEEAYKILHLFLL